MASATLSHAFVVLVLLVDLVLAHKHLIDLVHVVCVPLSVDLRHAVEVDVLLHHRVHHLEFLWLVLGTLWCQDLWLVEHELAWLNAVVLLLLLLSPLGGWSAAVFGILLGRGMELSHVSVLLMSSSLDVRAHFYGLLKFLDCIWSSPLLG